MPSYLVDHPAAPIAVTHPGPATHAVVLEFAGLTAPVVRLFDGAHAAQERAFGAAASMLGFVACASPPRKVGVFEVRPVL